MRSLLVGKERRLAKIIPSVLKNYVCASRVSEAGVMSYVPFNALLKNASGIRSFYYTQWLPFTSNKKRILLLAILSYIALC
jgi:hypothetical protein